MEIVGGRVDQRSALRAEQRARDLEYLNDESSLPRLRLCGKSVARSGGVQVVVRDERAHFRNVVRCASVHACPVCAAKIRQRRAEEVEALRERHTAAGGGVELVTLTVPHYAGDPLDVLLPAVTAAWRAMTQNRAGRDLKARYGFVGAVRALEVTNGQNGWHPHLHVVWLTARPLSELERELLHSDLHHAWVAAATAAGLRSPSFEHGVDVRDARAGGGVGRYMLGLELARSDLKPGREGHRSAFEILTDAVETGDVADRMRWREYEQATQGRNALTWSRGLKAMYSIGVQTDEEAVAETVGGVVVGTVAPLLWSELCKVRGGRAELRRIAVADGADGVADFLARCEVEYLGPIPYDWWDAESAQERKGRADEVRLAALRWSRMSDVERSRRFALL